MSPKVTSSPPSETNCPWGISPQTAVFPLRQPERTETVHVEAQGCECSGRPVWGVSHPHSQAHPPVQGRGPCPTQGSAGATCLTRVTQLVRWLLLRAPMSLQATPPAPEGQLITSSPLDTPGPSHEAHTEK